MIKVINSLVKTNYSNFFTFNEESRILHCRVLEKGQLKDGTNYVLVNNIEDGMDYKLTYSFIVKNYNIIKDKTIRIIFKGKKNYINDSGDTIEYSLFDIDEIVVKNK